MDPSDFKLLKERLQRLELSLQKMLEHTHEDLKIAESLQKLLSQNRLPNVPGLKVQARYIPALQICSESFDIVPTKDHKQIWFVMSWTQTHGLSSLLLQALVHLQSQAILDAKPKISLDEAFNDLSMALAEAKKEGLYRLTLCRLDVASLQMTGLSAGGAPLIFKKRRDWKILGEEAFQQNFAEHFTAPSSANPRLADKALAFSFTFEPGSRLFLMGASWNAKAANLQEYLHSLEIESMAQTEAHLLDDFNHLLIRAQKHLKTKNEENDLTLLAMEVDAKKLHLA